MNNTNLYVIYSYYEKNDAYKANLAYFLEYGYLPTVSYTFVINGECSIDIPKKDNITVIFRENIGFDFQGYLKGILSLKERDLLQNGKYYMFINCTVRGPFLQQFTKKYFNWYEPYMDLLTDNVKLVGSTINYVPKPHVQSYVFLMTCEGVNFLLSVDFFKIYPTVQETIIHQEVELSQLFLKKGWNISCLVPEYQGIDYTLQTGIHTHIVGQNLCPHELIFAKSSWGDPTGQVYSLSQRQLKCTNQVLIGQWICHKITYGKSPKHSKDVTHIIKELKSLDISNIKPNQLFGDPYPGKTKKLFININESKKPIILNEKSNRLIVDEVNYQFEYKDKELIIKAYLKTFKF